MNYSPIYYQLNKDERLLLSHYSHNVIDAMQSSELERAKKNALESVWRGDCPQWLESLNIDLIDYMHNCLHKDDNLPGRMLISYLDNIDNAYTGGVGYIDGAIMPRISGLIDYDIDIDAPHLVWLKIIDKKIDVLVEGGASDYDAYRYLEHTFELDLPFDKYSELVDQYHHHGMTVRQYLEWYLRSDANMDGDKPSVEFARRIGKTLADWCYDGVLTDEKAISLYRNFSVHPQHRDVLRAWAEKVIKIDDKSDNNSNIAL